MLGLLYTDLLCFCLAFPMEGESVENTAECGYRGCTEDFMRDRKVERVKYAVNESLVQRGSE